MKPNAPSAPIAIVTVTYSPGEYLTRFLDSVPAASSAGAVVVMADNGSTDGAPEAAAAEREGVELLHTGGNIGYGAGMNAGVEALRDRRAAGEIDGEFVLISNPDVVFDPGSIDEMVAAARRHPTAGAVGPLIREVDGSVYPSARSIPTLGAGIGHALLAPVWKNNPFTRRYLADSVMDTERTSGWLSGSCQLLRWEAFDAVGGFDERYFMYMEDVDLGDRLARAGWQNIFTPAAEITHAKGHSAGKHPEITLPAHHDSAYRFQADRLTAWWQAPVRWVLWVGLKARGKVAVALAQRARR
ncbi:MAG: glycosyltransferase family 2 protein [Corynebacterium sp.]|uniref:glycosyltransferase family 2 protein n=1 Tax=Corynebacterium sp. TaxID=1720 RepID=UPI0026475E39|nr:glycosyltransferase family 2 protein [Corynebacterium sp.]MDN5723513.1 glycosyltransferase family 2 protein [Corynebacterium sp.]MDN6283901.1 glycosyltransferase family 2 protein [Corynebacterium sp.]MDN6305720.1 glycosyltransferase family 2 protein [Corynebacterium sp.]MDN6353087.1 glycosyltransferase family 2 protein [Corynebacterium sp.]MDN6366804.1 glycosyltransferase family 2 protein [Corynebacterium sp.]